MPIYALGIAGLVAALTLGWTPLVQAQEIVYTAIQEKSNDGHLDAFTLGVSSSSSIIATFQQYLTAMTISPDGQTIYVTGPEVAVPNINNTNYANFVDTCTPNGQCSQATSFKYGVASLATSPNGASLYVTVDFYNPVNVNNDPTPLAVNQLQVCSTTDLNGTCPVLVNWSLSITVGFQTPNLVASQNGQYLYLTGGITGGTSATPTLEQYVLQGGGTTQLETFGKIPSGVAVSPDGSTVYTVIPDEGHVDQYYFGTPNQTTIYEFDTDKALPNSLAVDASNQNLFIGTTGNNWWLMQCPIQPPGQSISCSQLDFFNGPVNGVAVSTPVSAGPGGPRRPGPPVY